ncbi:hypothetical protein EV182_000456 [Spiromyces aspiralis]|uniref:Uncharacterized protein n=1 Tax=Spiromyces aspiralis TaxID=68401 RepID=A0ACC1HI20_9FUNG|nr:hypothetical protein EV182_000456 [Spiromyces aspiralis]
MDRETWLLWLLSDSQLPTGGFVASGGLEAGIQGGLVEGSAGRHYHFKPGPGVAEDRGDDRQHAKYSLSEFIKSSVVNQSRQVLPFASATHEAIFKCLARVCPPSAAAQGDGPDEQQVSMLVDEIADIDHLHNAMLSSNSVARRASLAQGSGLLSLFNRSYCVADIFGGDTATQAFLQRAGKQLQYLCRLQKMGGHWPVVFGFVCAALGIPLAKTQQLFLFTFVQQVFSAAVRLNLIGPLKAQTMQCEFYAFVSEILECHHHIRPKTTACYGENNNGEEEALFDIEVAYTDPLLELHQGMHDRLYSRLFNS